MQLTKFIWQSFKNSDKFGEKAEDVCPEMYIELLQNYTIDQVKKAFLAWMAKKPTFPRPSHIIEIIENPPPVDYSDVCCTCGMHYGIGVLSPEKRAKSYAWFRDKYTQGYDNEKRLWLEYYEKEHGKIE